MRVEVEVDRARKTREDHWPLVPIKILWLGHRVHYDVNVLRTPRTTI